MRVSSSGTSLGFQGGIVAVAGAPTEVTDPGSSDKVVVIGRDPLFDGLPGRLGGLFHVGLV